MSTHYGIELSVGFGFDVEDLFHQLGKPRQEKFHMEPRFDPKTGKKVSEEKVIDETSAIVVELGGKTFEMSLDDDNGDYEELAGAIAKHVGCKANISYEYGASFVVFEAPGRSRNESAASLDLPHLSIGAPLPVDAVVAESKKLERTAAALRKLGLKVGKPHVHISYSIG